MSQFSRLPPPLKYALFYGLFAPLAALGFHLFVEPSSDLRTMMLIALVLGLGLGVLKGGVEMFAIARARAVAARKTGRITGR